MSRILDNEPKIILACKLDAGGNVASSFDGYAVYGNISLSAGNTLRAIDPTCFIQIIVNFPIRLL